MDFTQLPYLVPYIIVIVISLGVAWYAWSHRRVVGALSFGFYASAQIISTIGYILELTAPTLQGKHFWDDFQWIGTSMAVVSAAIFGLRFTNRMPQWNRRTLIALSAAPLLFLVLVVTNGVHGWVRATGTITPGQPFDSLYYDFGPATWAIVIYIYVVLIVNIGILFQHAVKSKGIYRRQGVAVLLGMLVPVVGTILTLTEVVVFSQRDVVPGFYTIGNVIIAWGLFRYGLFDVVPVARERVLESMSESVIVLDTSNRIVEINPAARRAFNVPLADILGQDAANLFAQWPDLIARYDGVIEATEVINATVNDHENYFELKILPLYDNRQRLTGRLIVLDNITELVEARRRAEATRDKALEADRIKSQFLASMSHELRTPLNAILNFSKLLRKGVVGPVTERQQELLNEVVSSGEHLLNMVNDVLDVSKIQGGMLNLFVEDQVDVYPLINMAITTTRTLIEDKPVEIVEDIDSGLPPLLCDRRRVQQILLNLLSNAAKFTEEGTITVSAKNRGDHILLAVIDTGVGIAADQRDLIFEPFSQTLRGRRQTHGTGLGLPITRNLVEAHGGEIWFESEEGDGTVFMVKLPVESPALRERLQEDAI